jgi:hypothetical protein
VALVRTNVSEERVASIIRVTRISEIGTMLAVTSNRNTLRHGVTSQKKVFFICSIDWNGLASRHGDNIVRRVTESASVAGLMGPNLVQVEKFSAVLRGIHEKYTFTSRRVYDLGD